VALVDRLETPPPDLLARYAEITLVRRPEGVTDIPLAFRAAALQAEKKWGHPPELSPELAESASRRHPL